MCVSVVFDGSLTHSHIFHVLGWSTHFGENHVRVCFSFICSVRDR